MDFFDCKSLQEAIEMIAGQIAGLRTEVEKVSLMESLSRIVGEDITTQEDVPAFSRSTVDGFAVRGADTFGAGEGVPVVLHISGEVRMGETADETVVSGQAVEMPTGGMLPPGTDAVVMLEHVEIIDNQTVMILKAAAPGENVIARGEDIRSGSLLIKAGQQIMPQDIGALAACGFVRVPVRCKPKVAILSSGDEVVDASDQPTGGQIRDINSYALAAMLTQAGCTVTRCGIIADRYEDVLHALGEASSWAQLVLISGGSSVGARDHTVKAIEALGVPGVLFHGVTMKPGKPTIFGMIGNVPVFGLPGHPVAAMTVCDRLVGLTVRTMLGQALTRNKRAFRAKLTRNMASAPGRDDFIRVRLIQQEGEYFAEPVLGKSGLISTMVKADGVVHIPSEKSGLYAGEWVEVEVLRQTVEQE